MEMWGVNQNWEQACQRGLPGKLGVGGNYLWCLVIVIFRGLGRAKRLGGGGGFKAIIWWRASHKEGGGEAISMGEADPLVTIGLSSYYYIFNTIKGTLMQIWKSLYVFGFRSKQYPENFAFLLLRILELFAREICEFLKN